MIEKGFTVINQVRVNGQLPEDTTYEQFMSMTRLMLSFCDAIYLMKNWKDSPGAVKEWQWAFDMGKDIIMEVEDE